MASILGSRLTASELRWAIGGWTFFIAENAILSENRTLLIDLLGGSEDLYHAIYGTGSTLALSFIVYGYRKLRNSIPAAVVVYPIAAWRLALGGVFMGVGLGVLGFQTLPKLQVPVQILQSHDAAVTTSKESLGSSSSGDNDKKPSWNIQVRCPFDFTDRRRNDETTQDSITGVHRVSRHPGLWALGLTCCGNAFLQPTLPLSLFFLGPMAVAGFGGAHTDSRYRRNLGGSMDPTYTEATSNVPFLAMILGKQGTRAFSDWVAELKVTNVAVGLLVTCGYVISRGRASHRAVKATLLQSSH